VSDVKDRLSVAESMREEADGYRRNEAMYGYVSRFDTGEIPGMFQDLAQFVGLRGYVRTDELFDRLSDLIDPTCEMLEMDDYQPSHKFKRWNCSHCGAVNFAPFATKRVTYCNSCGHRATLYGFQESEGMSPKLVDELSGKVVCDHVYKNALNTRDRD
jgi:hypothetical protein